MGWGFIYHTNTTRGNVGSNHDGALSGLELVQDPITLSLLLVTVNGETRPTVLAEESGDVVGGTLGTSEDKALARLVVHDLLEVLDKSVKIISR